MNVLKQSIRIIFIITILSSFSKGQGSYNNNKSTEVSSTDSTALSELMIGEKKSNTSSPLSFQALNENQTLNNEPASMMPDGTLWRDKPDIDYLKLGGVMGGILAVDIIGYYKLKDSWYNHPTTKMHAENFQLDRRLYQQMDKFGHLMHAYYATGLVSRLYRWSGFSGENSIIYGALTGWLWMLQIEIADSFFDEWGFSWIDLTANTVGVSFSALQQLYPDALDGLQLKFSYHTSEALRERRYNNGSKLWVDDYEGLTWWLAVNVYHYLPANVQQNYPEWLKPFGLAVGHSAKRIADDPLHGEREIFLGLDYDLRKLPIGEDSDILKFLKNELNIIRLPLPAVRITPSGVWYGLYF
jgi:hypothetical protein